MPLKSTITSLGIRSLFLSLLLVAEPLAAEPLVTIMTTPSGIEFGHMGEKPSSPAPTLFVFAGTTETLIRERYNRIGWTLADQGFLIVSLDLPCHGNNQLPNEPAGLKGWPYRLERGDCFVDDFVGRLSSVLDFLVQESYTDPEKVSACGTSRGGFMALHFAARDPRVQRVVAFAPVTDLLVLTEFKHMKNPQAAQSLDLTRFARQLADRDVWLAIGHRDDRVGTERTVGLAQEILEAGSRLEQTGDLELHVLSVEGHGVPLSAHDEAATWILFRIIPSVQH